jgi:vacuolar-type H+-ATPase subunit E/Vma4
MKIKIIDALKTKYKTLGFSDKAFDGVADYLSHHITKEEDLETGIAGVESLLKSFQSDIDRRVTEAIATTKAAAEKAAADKAAAEKAAAEGTDKPKPTEEMPEWLKPILEANEALKKKLEGIESKTTQQELTTKLKAKLAEAKIPEKFSKSILSGRSLKDEAEVEALANEVVTSWKEVEQDFADKGLGLMPKPLFGKPTGEGVTPAVAEYIKEKTAPTTEKPLGGKEVKS